MNCMRFLVVASIVLIAAMGWTNPLVAAPDAARTLAPYFLVEGEESSADQFPLKSTDVQVTIAGVIADVTVKQSYENDGDARPRQYVFPASTRAAVHGMKMTIGENVIVARSGSGRPPRQSSRGRRAGRPPRCSSSSGRTSSR